MFPRSIESPVSVAEDASIFATDIDAVMAQSDALVAIDDVQKSLNRSRASVYRYTNTDSRNLNPPFNLKKLNPEFRSDQKGREGSEHGIEHPHHTGVRTTESSRRQNPFPGRGQSPEIDVRRE